MRAGIICFLAYILLAFGAVAQDCTCNDDNGVIFLPVVPVPNFWESVSSVQEKSVLDPEIRQMIKVCVISLDEHPMEFGDGIPVDEDGIQLILDSDGLTWQSASELIDGVDPKTCKWNFDEQGVS